MIRAAVIGFPIAQSLSPLIHQYWFRRHGIEGSYEAIEVHHDYLAARIEALTKDGYAGFNVTVPHKQNIMALCDTLDDTARQIGAVNTVVIKDGKREGRNTDAFGFIENIRQEAPGFDFGKGPALVIGAGGAARAIVYGLLQQGVPEILITNRTKENAEILANDFPRLKVVDWEKRSEACDGAALLVNTSVLGMRGQPPLEMDLSALSVHAHVCDIVYKPLMTDLLQRASARGCGIITGIGMLLHQARPAFASWTSVMPDVTKELQGLITEKAH